ncbi:MAG: hypothetical protein M1838_000971 [Thelocarpon superellum]|nr:MAG: hypothetical protein M1838_000971 [Thelocarpon superellum]
MTSPSRTPSMGKESGGDVNQSMDDHSSVAEELYEQFETHGMSKQEFRAMVDAAPPEEIEMAQRVIDSPRRRKRSTDVAIDLDVVFESASDDDPYSQLKQYGQQRPLYRELYREPLSPPMTSACRKYTRDIYDQARALGWTSEAAKVDLKLAGLEFRQARRFMQILEWIDMARGEGRTVGGELMRIRDSESGKVLGKEEEEEDSETSTAASDPEVTPPSPDCIDAPTPMVRRKRSQRPRMPVHSPYFTSALGAKNGRSLAGTASCIPFTPISSAVFGLVQERLAEDPFRLLVAVTFLNRTRGLQAIPVFYRLMEAYPTPEALASADEQAVAELIRHLGLQNTRARRYVRLAKAWVEDPPIRGRRHRRLNYPTLGAGRAIKPRGVVPDETEDARDGAFEIAHLPTAGPYALDSWRIFCRDRLRGVATGWNSEDAATTDFEPEWKRVVPLDKELRAFLRWMWLKEGWEWDPRTGHRARASDELMKHAMDGTIVWEEAMDEGRDENAACTLATS